MASRYKYKYRRQPPIKGGRIPTYAGYEKMVYDWLAEEARAYGVSIPFVESTIIADYANIKLPPEFRYDSRPRKTRAS